MKKISTKIVVLSLINSIIVALTNVGMSIYNNNHMQISGTGTASGAAANADTTGAAITAAQAGPQNSGMLFHMPTPILIGLLVSLILGVIMAYILGKFISKPIIKVTELTKRTAELDLIHDESFEQTLKYKDECGAMAMALEDTRKSLRKVAEKLQSISYSLVTHSQNLTGATDESVKTITQVVATINEIAEGNSSQAQTINDINSILSEVVKLIENITAETALGAENAVKSLDTITEGQNAVDIQVHRMEESIKVSYEANESIDELSKMIEQVASIVNVITSIADQTNLLALNAAIEAARAGEAGKGFAVVADEIRNLAEESSKAAKKITEIIKDTTEKTNMAVTNMNKSNLLVAEQKNALNITQDAFSKIKATYDHIVNSFKQTAAGMKTINEKSKSIFTQTQDMAAIAEQSAASTEEISAAGQEQLASIELIAQSSKDLSNIAEDLKNEINRFRI